MSGHTPGPWELRREKRAGRVPRILVGDANGFADIGEVYTNYSEELGRDDARLIAAAPEMAALLIAYEELEGEMILDDECWGVDEGLPTRYYDRLIALQTRRNAVLEKAGLSFEIRTKEAQ